MMNVELALEETESFLNERKHDIPEDVFNYLVRICEEERKCIDMVKSWNEEKKVLKVKPV